VWLPLRMKLKSLLPHICAQQFLYSEWPKSCRKCISEYST